MFKLKNRIKSLHFKVFFDTVYVNSEIGIILQVTQIQLIHLPTFLLLLEYLYTFYALIQVNQTFLAFATISGISAVGA